MQALDYSVAFVGMTFLGINVLAFYKKYYYINSATDNVNLIENYIELKRLKGKQQDGNKSLGSWG